MTAVEAYQASIRAALRAGGQDGAAPAVAAGPALRALERLEPPAGRLRELAEMSALVTAAAEGDDQIELYERELNLWRYRIVDAEQAQLRARKLVELYPEHPTVRLVLGQLLGELGRAAEWAELLEQEAELTSDAQRAAWLWHKQAGLLERDLADPGRALQAYRRSLDGGYAPAGWDVARLSEAQHQFAELTDVYRGALVEAGARGSKRKAAQAAVRLGALLQHELGDSSGALEAYGEALRQLEDDVALWRAMGRVARRSGDPGRLAEARSRELAVLPALDASSASEQVRLRMALLVRMAELQSDKLERPEVGAQELGRALALQPSSVLVQRALVELHTRAETFSELADLYLAELREASGLDPRVRAYERLARLDADHRADEPSAVLAYEAIIEADMGHQPSLRALERYDLAPGSERETALVSVYQKLAAVLPPPDALALRMELARLRRRLEGEGAQLEELRAALVLDPRHIPAVLHLETAARVAGDASALAECYDALADMLEEPVARSLCLLRAGDFLASTGAASTGAATVPRGDDAVTARYRAGAWAAPSYLPVQDALVFRLLEKRAHTPATPPAPPRSEPAAPGATPEDAGWREVADAFEAQAQASRDKQGIGTSWLLAGMLWQDRIGEPARALPALRNAFEARPDDGDAYRRLHRLYQTQGDYVSLVELIGKRAQVETSQPALAAMHRERAQLELTRLHRAEDAKLSLRRLLAIEANDQEALTQIGDLYYKDGQYAEAADAFIRRARITKDPAVLKDLFLKLGIIYDDKLPDMKRAVASFRKVIEFDSRNLMALEKLSQIHLREWEWQGALQATLRLCELTVDDPERRREYLTRLAKIYEDGLQDPRRAVDAYRRALELDPGHIGTIGELAGFHSRQKDETSLAVHLDQAATLVRTRIAADPGDTTLYRHLFQIFGWRRAVDATVCAAQLLDTFGQADDAARELLRRAAGRPQPLPSQLGGTPPPRPGAPPATPDGTDDLLIMPAIGPAQRQLLSMVMETLDKTYPGDLRRYQVGRGDKLAARSGHHARELAERLAQALGLGEFEIYLCKSQPYVCLVENTSPPSLILGAELVAKSDPVELRFLLGRLLKIVQLGLVLPARLPATDLGVLITALGRQHVVDFSPEGIDSAQVTVEEKRLSKALPKRVRQEVQPFCYELAGEFKGGVALSRAIHGTASRVGLLAAGSVGPAVTALRRMGGDPGAGDPSTLVAQVRNVAEVAELVRFAVSSEHFELRRRLGIAVG
jgi:tetratricopeptide (TPR) repeat protein